MSFWRGFVLFEKTANLNQANFNTLCDDFTTLPPVRPSTPAHYMQVRASLDGSKRFFEMKFDPTKVEVEAFKAYMASLFPGVEVADVSDEILETVSYSGLPGVTSRRWGFNYPIGGSRRLEVVRFGQGGSYADSHAELLAYLKATLADWEPLE